MSAPFGVYIHIPFCSRRCDYCAFATWSDRHHLHDAYLDALELEIDRAIDGGLPEATSIFVGGGTPSLVDPDRLARIIDRVPRVAGAETTIECNPESTTSRHMERFVGVGVNRISFGVQSMSQKVLIALGRDHDSQSVRDAVRVAREAGIARINLDLIYGGVTESLDDWRYTIEEVISLGPDHVSAYALTVEAGTPLADDPARHPDEDDQADKYLIADEILSAGGLLNYEISNWARPGQECDHNLLYWRQGDYRGFGCAAHSHSSGRRWWNVRTPDRYIELISAKASVEAAGEDLDLDRRRIEGLQLALRTRDGIPVDSLSDEDREELQPLLEIHDGRLSLTREGRLLANEVAVRVR